jgi:uncharacterized protein
VGGELLVGRYQLRPPRLLGAALATAEVGGQPLVDLGERLGPEAVDPHESSPKRGLKKSGRSSQAGGDPWEAVMDKVVHFEVPFDDGERATAFYREAFGWQLNSMPQMQYTLVTTTPTDDQGRLAEAGGINGGMLHRQGPITSPIITIGVDDIDDSLARIEKLGGKVAIGRQPVGDMGFSAYAHDTEGNLIGLWQNAA